MTQRTSVRNVAGYVRQSLLNLAREKWADEASAHRDTHLPTRETSRGCIAT